VAQLVITAASWGQMEGASGNILSPVAALSAKSNTHAIGQVLYTDYVYPFQVAGLILLVAMIGAITLTLRTRAGVRKQDIYEQMQRKREDVLVIAKVEKGRGI